MISRPAHDRLGGFRARPDQDAFRLRARSPDRRAAKVLAMIALGGGLGSVARYLVTEAIPVSAGGFPWGTFLINVTGCFLLGLLMVFVLQVWPPTRYVRPFLGIGFLGGYTTFSAFTAEIVHLAGDGVWTPADLYALDSLLAGLFAVWCGTALARAVAGLPHRRRGEGSRR
ncbi:fluoride efflux transporter CrcB [Nonomuraea sp. NPDC048916]|uniref:fluoride efflux transporter CrcB n=1 Tax=Nonomuraea sp. NPDC048916 TaxID=3154232 RepID=UPI0033EE10F8